MIYKQLVSTEKLLVSGRWYRRTTWNKPCDICKGEDNNCPMCGGKGFVRSTIYEELKDAD